MFKIIGLFLSKTYVRHMKHRLSDFPETVTSKLPNFEIDDPSICEDYLEMFIYEDSSRRNETIRLTNTLKANDVRCFCVFTQSWFNTIVGGSIALARGFYTKNLY